VLNEAKVMLVVMVVGHASTESVSHAAFVVQHVGDVHHLGRG
jgi:hypothetical protein